MSDQEFRSFEEFWPFYLGEHAHPANRQLHFLGSSLAAAVALGALAKRKPAGVLGGLVVGYGFAWAGHFLVEKNRPATFRHPLWSLRGDWVMWWKMLTGTLDAELTRVRAEADARSDAARDAPAAGDARAWN
jgi:hypothetical protein